MRLYDIIPPDSILTSGQLAARLIATGTSHQAARKAMSRNRDPAVWILPVSLPRRVRMFARRDSVRNTAFYQKLATALNDLRPGLARTILALLQRRILLRFDAQRLLAAPSQPRSSRTPTYAAELSVLAELGLCKVEGTDTALERITINQRGWRPSPCRPRASSSKAFPQRPEVLRRALDDRSARQTSERRVSKHRSAQAHYGGASRKAGYHRSGSPDTLAL